MHELWSIILLTENAPFLPWSWKYSVRTIKWYNKMLTKIILFFKSVLKNSCSEGCQKIAVKIFEK